MKTLKFWLVAVFVLIGCMVFLMPYKSYYPSFIFTSNHQAIERIADDFSQWSMVGKVCFLVVFAPAMAFSLWQTQWQKNLPGLLVFSFVLSAMLFLMSLLLGFGLFEAQTKFLFGYYVFLILGAAGCVVFWIMATCEICCRIHNWRQKIKGA